MSRTRQLAALLLAFAVCSHVSASEELKARFLREYPAHAQKLQRYYSQGHWTAHYRRDALASQYTDLSLKSAGDMFCLSATLRAGEAVIKPGHEVICLMTPEGKAFDLDRLPNQKRYQVNPDSSSPADARRMVHREMYPLVAAYSVQWEPVAQWLAKPDMQVLDVTEQPGNKHKLWKVESEQPLDSPRLGPVKTWGWFTVRPEQEMVIESYEFSLGTAAQPFSHAMRGEVQYADATNGQPPLVAACDTWTEGGVERTREAGAVWSNVRFEHRQISPHEFEPAAFGIYDWQPHQRWGGALAMGALGLGLVGYVAKRRRTANSPTDQTPLN